MGHGELTVFSCTILPKRAKEPLVISFVLRVLKSPNFLNVSQRLYETLDLRTGITKGHICMLVIGIPVWTALATRSTAEPVLSDEDVASEMVQWCQERRC